MAKSVRVGNVAPVCDVCSKAWGRDVPCLFPPHYQPPAAPAKSKPPGPPKDEG